MRKQLAHIIVAILLVTVSCHKDKPGSTIIPASKGVYLINQGNYGYGNGEISFYNPVSQQESNNLFSSANHYSLGDVAQSMYIKDSLGFIVVNNSQKIEEVQIPSFQHIRTITIPNSSPRYFLPVNDSLAYISELYQGKIHVVNYLTGALVSDITGVAGWTEHMISQGNTVIVEEQNFEDSTTASLAVINAQSNSFVQRYYFPGGNSDGIVKDNQNHIWMAVDEDSAQAIPASLYCLNSDMSVNKRLQFAMGHHPQNLCIDGSGSQLYFFDDGIYTLSISSNAVPANSFSPGNGRNFYALGIDPVSGDVYAADALDYVQSSRIYRYNSAGTLIESFTAGIITGNFTFNE